MKKTFLFASIGAVIILTFCGCPPHKKVVWENNEVIAHYSKDIINEPTDTTSPKAEIYIDASGSMKPYFGENVAENLINTISEINNLNPAGTTIYFQDYPQPCKGKISSIITNIKQQPNLRASIFYDFFKEQADKIDTTNVLTYLVTDAIMSEGDGQGGFINMNLSLKQLEGKITTALKGHSDLAGAILRYEGGYEGYYWNQKNQRITSKQCPLLKDPITRPYYVIVLGRKEAIRYLHVLPDNKLNNPEGKLFMGIHDLAGHNKAKLDKGDSAHLQNLSNPTFLYLELPPCLTDLDVTKVKVMCNGEILQTNVNKNEKGRLSAELPIDKALKPDAEGRITVSFVVDNEIPTEWLTTWSTNDDENGPDLLTTFGLSTLVEGMFEGLEGSDSKMLSFEFKYLLP